MYASAMILTDMHKDKSRKGKKAISSFLLFHILTIT